MAELAVGVARDGGGDADDDRAGGDGDALGSGSPDFRDGRREGRVSPKLHDSDGLLVLVGEGLGRKEAGERRLGDELAVWQEGRKAGKMLKTPMGRAGSDDAEDDNWKN